MNTLHEHIEDWLDTVAKSRSPKTWHTYKTASVAFEAVLAENGIDSSKESAEILDEQGMIWFLKYLKKFSTATERLYMVAIRGFYRYCLAERVVPKLNFERLNEIVRQRARKNSIRAPQFDMEAVEKILAYVSAEVLQPTDEIEQLRRLRNRAFLLSLADSGMRVNEACELTRGDINWLDQRAVIVGKGDKQAVIRFRARSIKAMQEYLRARAKIDGATGKPMTSLPVFARHDKSNGYKNVNRIGTNTGRTIIAEYVAKALGSDYAGLITPHTFRHYFVTRVYEASGGQLKLAQEMARHANINTTGRYAHLLDQTLDQKYYEIFEKDDQ